MITIWNKNNIPVKQLSTMCELGIKIAISKTFWNNLEESELTMILWQDTLQANLI